MEIAETWYFQIWVNFGGMAAQYYASHFKLMGSGRNSKASKLL